MADIKLFRLDDRTVRELAGTAVALEKSLQARIEAHLETFFGVRFLATEYVTGKKHGGRIDTLGIDENGAPVIIEYKRAMNENVINQGLFYLDWLLDHKGEFQLLVMNEHGKDLADQIEWKSARLLCIAGDFTRYDRHAVEQIDRNIELVRYRRYGDDLLLFELVNTTTAGPSPTPKMTPAPPSNGPEPGTVGYYLAKADEALTDRYAALRAFLTSLGDDVTETERKLYVAFRRIKNFACVEVHPQKGTLLIFLKVDPDGVDLEPGFSRDVRSIGHFGTGDLELTLRTMEDLNRAKPLIERSYESS